MTPRLKRLVLTWALSALTAFVVGGCGSTPVAPTSDKGDPAEEYAAEKRRLETSKVIAPGFLLSIEHSADEGISGEFRVGIKGELKLPYKVKVMAAGRTVDELERDLVRAYSSYFKSGNSVRVSIVTREYLVELRGLVKKPGQYTVKIDTSLEETIALAGGISTLNGDNGSAKPEWVRIVRPDFTRKDAPARVIWIRLADYFSKYDVRNESLWHGGEQIFLQVTGDQNATKGMSQTVQIMGEVRQPGEFALQSGATLHAYLSRAGGVTSGADLENVTVISAATKSSHTYDVGDSMDVVNLEPGDVIMVKAKDNKAGFFERIGPVLISAGSLVLSVLIAIATL